MALKRKTKTNAIFSMASMTDIIFLLLIFFMVTSTVVVPNAIKVNLPQAQKQTATKPLTRVTIRPKKDSPYNSNGNQREKTASFDKNVPFDYYIAYGNQREKEALFDEIVPFLLKRFEEDPDMYVALYADEKVPYGEIVKFMELVYVNKLNMVFMTRPPDK